MNTLMITGLIAMGAIQFRRLLSQKNRRDIVVFAFTFVAVTGISVFYALDMLRLSAWIQDFVRFMHETLGLGF